MSNGNTIKVRENGPLLCTGDIEVYNVDGDLLIRSNDVVLCRCGHSKTKPICDGSHKTLGFVDAGNFDDPKTESLAASAPLRITTRSNAMLIAKGPMTIINSDRSCSTTRNKAALCRCGHSKHKPFCDTRHKVNNFTD